MSHLLPRYCHASSSRNVLSSVTAPAVRLRRLSLLPQRHDLMPFFIPLHGPNGNNAIGVPGLGEGKGKGRMPPSKPNMEDEVDDREWEMRAARAMLHLRDTLPRFFDHDQSSAALFPPEIFSKDILLKLPQPLPLQISSLYAYTMAFAIARQGMQALHTDLYTNLDRMTYTPAPKDLVTSQTTAMLLSRRGIPSHRQKQIRVLVSVHARQRLLPNHEAVWKTSSLYTLSPVSGLISKHEVESIRPLPGEGVAEWLKNKLLGWTKQGDVQHEQGIPCPRAVRVPAEREMMRARRERMKE